MNHPSEREYDNYRSDESDSKFKPEQKLHLSSQNNNRKVKFIIVLGKC